MEYANASAEKIRNDEYRISYSCDENLDESSCSVNKTPDGRIKFTGRDRGGTMYGHTSARAMPFSFTLSGGRVNGTYYQTTLKGGDPTNYL